MIENSLLLTIYGFSGVCTIFVFQIQGDMVKLLRQIDDNWFEGENNNEIGILPIAYIEVQFSFQFVF